MNFRGLIVVVIGTLLIAMAVKDTHRQVFALLTGQPAGAVNNNTINSGGNGLGPQNLGPGWQK